MIINLTTSKYSDNVIEITFHGVNNDWFTALFPLVDVDLKKMKEFYIGRDFYKTKDSYSGKIFVEDGK